MRGSFRVAKDTVSFGKLIRYPKKGTAKLVVNVPYPGTLLLNGKRVVKQRRAYRAGATASSAGSAEGKMRLLIKARGKAKRRLNRTGKLKVRAKVTYTPNGGVAHAKSKAIKLIKR